MSFIFFFFNDTATTEIYTLSLHDALPIFEYVDSIIADVKWLIEGWADDRLGFKAAGATPEKKDGDFYLPAGKAGKNPQDRKSTRLNSSHSQISYAVFCLKKKNRDLLRRIR